MKEEEVELVWSPRWTWQNVAERRCENGKVEVKWHLGRCPLSKQKWPSWGGATRWSQSISNNGALQQLVHYLLVRFLHQLCVLVYILVLCYMFFLLLFLQECEGKYVDAWGSLQCCNMFDGLKSWQNAYFFTTLYLH